MDKRDFTLTDEILAAVRGDLRLHELAVNTLVHDADYTKALDEQVARLKAENPHLARLFGRPCGC